MRQLVIALAALSILVAACSRSHTLSDRANGTWINDFATITLDFPNHKATSVIMGEQTIAPGLEVLSENGNVVIVKDLGDVQQQSMREKRKVVKYAQKSPHSCLTAPSRHSSTTSGIAKRNAPNIKQLSLATKT